MIRMFEGLVDNEALYNLVKRIYFMNLRYDGAKRAQQRWRS